METKQRSESAAEAPVGRAAKKAAVRERLLTVAARAIREHGTERVRVDDVMNEVGLTRGTFYAHFASKDELVAEALRFAADTFRTDLYARSKEGIGRERLGRLADAYLTPAHAQDPGAGCFIAALGTEMNRADGSVGEAFGEKIEAGIAMIEGMLEEAEGPSRDHRDRAVASLATVVGGMIIARAQADPKQRDRALAACRNALAERNHRSVRSNAQDDRMETLQ